MPVDEQWDHSDVGPVDGEPEAEPARPKRVTAPKPLTRTRPTSAPPPVPPPPAPPPPAPPPPVMSPQALLSVQPQPAPATKPVESSLQLLAKDLMPPARAVEPPPPPEIPLNLGRTVRALPPWTRAWRWLRGHAGKLVRTKRQRWIVAGVGGVLVIGLVAAFATRGGGSGSGGGDSRGVAISELAQRAHGQVTARKYRDALATYEAVLVARPQSAVDPAVSTDLGKIADGATADAETADAALDALAWQVGGPGYEALLARTVSKSAGVRHHAVALADAEGIGDRVDHVAGWLLDIGQTKSCEQKRDLAAKVAAAHDKRAALAQREAAKGCASGTTGTPTATGTTNTKSGTRHRPKPRW